MRIKVTMIMPSVIVMILMSGVVSVIVMPIHLFANIKRVPTGCVEQTDKGRLRCQRREGLFQP